MREDGTYATPRPYAARVSAAKHSAIAGRPPVYQACLDL